MSEKKISADEFIRLLKETPHEVLKNLDGKTIIYFNDYNIEDEHIILDDSIKINLPIKFEGCNFSSDNLFFIDGLTCNEEVLFEACSFSCAIYFSSGTFKKELCFKYVHVSRIEFNGGTFETINIAAYDPGVIWISNAKFEKLHIGRDLINNNIGKLVIFANENTGNIIVNDHSLDEFHLSGTNTNKRFVFSKIKCDKILIDNFKNDGILNFFGCEPKPSSALNERYFQIVNSNLNNTQFHRVFFSQYKEMIIIDSFITDALFIACRWKNNIRSLRGPGFLGFEDTILSGRKIILEETYAIREAYRQLKISMSKHSDKIQENKFYAEELNFYNSTLKWSSPFRNSFWDKLILYASKVFSDYGQSFIRPLFWLLTGHLILFVIALSLNGYHPLQISLCNANSSAFEQAFEKYFIYINPFRKLETSLAGYLITIDILMRIWSSYMLYNLIRASRRFIS